jgi:hypothetical protein
MRGRTFVAVSLAMMLLGGIIAGVRTPKIWMA